MLHKTLFYFIFFCLISTLNAEQSSAAKSKILIGSPVKQKPNILKEFLYSLQQLSRTTIETDYCFIDDNDNTESGQLLYQFAQQVPTRCFIYKSNPIDQQYICDEKTHHWNEMLVWRVAEFKNFIMKKALEDNYDYVFLIDSDIVLNPQTLGHLVQTGKDIISEIFWTRWNQQDQELPQVWISDFYTLNEEFLKQIRIPGVYEVGGLGACTLISKKALSTGINFNKIKNITFWGEDRHFCVRACALGLSLFVDTHHPAYHIYRESALEGLNEFKKKNNLIEQEIPKKNYKITLSMCVKNEADHYLRPMLEAAREYIDEAVIIDDGSTDNTCAVCEEIFKNIPLHIVKNTVSKFANEIELRQQQWEETIKTNPDWIVFLDADQIFEKRFAQEVRRLCSQSVYHVFYFRLYDFWDEHHYRDDHYWYAHNTYRPLLVRYIKDFPYQWKIQPQHCGSMPCNINLLPGAYSDLRLKHYGWAKKEDRLKKYKRYQQLDPDGKYGILAQYESLLDEHPNLVEWVE